MKPDGNLDLRTELDRFHEWTRQTTGSTQEWDIEYPDWHRLTGAAQDALRRSSLDSAEVLSLLEVLALDHEAETIRNALVEAPELGILLARSALSYPKADARWQLADFLGTRSEPAAVALLRRYMEDPDEYVRRRALLAAQHNDSAFAESVAARWLTAEHEYSRLAALSVLSELPSPQLAAALDALRDDPSEMIRSKVAELRRARSA